MMKFNRAVIKVGSALVSPDAKGCSGKYLLAIARFITQCQQAGKEIILVSSGSVAAGRSLITHGSPNPSIPTKQAMASVGQMQMMANWQRFFDVPCSQLLITHGDLKDRQRYINIKNTLRILLENGVIPIVNENDTVATEELKVGDNDNLAALVALVSEADSLFILSDVDGVFEQDPRINPQAKLIPEIAKIDDSVYALAGATNNHIATGGMKTKIQAAEKAVSHGIDTYIVNGFKADSFKTLLANGNPGTHFYSHKNPMLDGVHWMRHTTRAQGELIVGNQYDITDTESSDLLLAEDLLSVKGDFSSGDIVMLRKDNGDKLAKVKTNYSSCLLNFVADSDNQDFSEQLDKTQEPIISKQYIALMES